MKDTRTPVIISFWTLLANVVAGLLLMQFMGHAGLALALTLASLVNAVVLIFMLSRRLGDLDLSGLMATATRMVPGLCLMAIVVLYLLAPVDWLIAGEFLPRFIRLFGAVMLGGLVYCAGLWVMRVQEVKQLWTICADRFTSRFARGGNGI
jgi:putative peptidoglycan lipid II flippase